MIEGPTDDTPSGRRPLDAMAIWRWGFAVLLVVAGIWLVYTAPHVGGASGRTIGWIMIGYAAVRLALGYLGRGGRRAGDGR